VVDDAIVVIENITRSLEMGSTLEAALRGSKEIGFTVLSMSTSLVARVHSHSADGRHRRPHLSRVIAVTLERWPNHLLDIVSLTTRR